MADRITRPQARRSFLGLAALAGLSLFIAGCQMVPRSRPAPPEPVPTPTPEPTPGLPTDTDRNRVAVLVPLSGENAGIGQSIANAANLAILDTGGQRIHITVSDPAKVSAAPANEPPPDAHRPSLGPPPRTDGRTSTPP